jgi:hypothetical protein
MHFDESRLREWREAVLRRDHHKCQQCGSRGKLHAHHKKQKSIHPSLAYAVSNGTTLCQKCHMALHKKIGFGKHSWKEIYQKYICKSHKSHYKRVEHRNKPISSRVKHTKLVYRVVRGSKVSHRW